jgi:hypothetical protein
MNELRDSTEGRSKLCVVTIDQLLSMDIPEPELILAPWLRTQSLSMIHAWRGVGKTHVALGIAYAVASGGEFLRWKATRNMGASHAARWQGRALHSPLRQARIPKG